MLSRGLPQPKPVKRATVKRRRRQQLALEIAAVRAAVFERDFYRCRVCMRPAESMHEIVPRSLGGKVSTVNSIATCGDGLRGCHGKLQRHELDAVVWKPELGANGPLVFSPRR